MRYDFSGWATRNDLKCSDGRTIRKDAFKSNDGQPAAKRFIHCFTTSCKMDFVVKQKNPAGRLRPTGKDWVIICCSLSVSCCQAPR